MDSASRLYERLGQIPQDPEDPESLEDLLVCAFGAFERYYVCWKTKGGEYRQDGYDLPEALQEWLFPADGSTRDFPTLQVVFGRGEEYFAADKSGKLEYKEPEVKKPQTPIESTVKDEKPPLRRSRTISFMRPLSDPSTKPMSPAMDTVNGEVSNRRSSSASATSRPPSTSFPRPTSDPAQNPSALIAEIISSPESSRRSSFISQPTSRSPSISSSRPTSDSTSRSFSPVQESPVKETAAEPPLASTRLVRRSTRPLSVSFNPGAFPKITEGKKLSPSSKRDSNEYHCTCCRHNPPNVPKYADASIQTDPEPLRINTNTGDNPNYPSYSNYSSALDVDTPLTDDLPPPPANPVFMGRMMDYFGNPRYQLGDSLMSSYYYFQQPVYYQEEVVYEEDWKGAEGMGQTV